ncbi:MAG TPA: SH3 domain-containing protein [Candidatus Limnocylindrales bacterium]
MRTRTGLGRSAVRPLLALGAALFVAFALVAPVLAVEGPTKLIDASVSPRTGTPSTTIAFAVKYRNREGSAPDHVSVVIDGTAHRMRSAGGSNWKSGVVHTWSSTLPAGRHSVSFEAADTRRFSDTLDAGTVTITNPTTQPTSTPRPDATPRPEPTPTPSPDTNPAPGGTVTPPSDGTDGTGGTAGSDPTYPTGASGSDTGSPAPGAPSGSDSTSSGGGDTTDPDSPDGPFGGLVGPGTIDGGDNSAGGSDLPGGGTGGWSHGSDPGLGDLPDAPATGATGGTETTSDSTTSASGSDGGAGTGGSGWGTLASALQTLGIERPTTLTTLPMLVGTSSAMTMAFAFAIFGKKRRDEQPPAPDDVLQANAARGHAGLPGSNAINGVVSAAAVPAPLDLEAGMPRWRRPSLLEARKADPTRSTASSHHMSFDGGLVPATEGHERRIIRYSVVRLLDAPDELRSAEIGQLDRGDEVVLLERSGTYWLVLCPDGRQGWLHKMTLGDVVTDAAPGSAPSFNREEEDSLAAFLTARAQA